LGGYGLEIKEHFLNKIPSGLTVIYFDDKDKNIYAELPPDKEQAKKLSRLVYREAMTTISTEKTTDKPQD
jgi:hypothetical protein